MKIRTRILLASLLIVVGWVLTSVFSDPTDLLLAAGDVSLRGMVIDSAGKPIRGGVVKATSGGKAVAVYTNRDGRYQIEGLKATMSMIEMIARPSC